MNPFSVRRTSVSPRIVCIAIGLVWLVGCAHPDQLRAGMSRDELNSRFGRPAVERHDPSGDDVLIYTSAPLGQRASAAHVGSDGRVAWVEPLLNTEHFAQIRVDQWNKQDVLNHFGTPAEKRATMQYKDVWSYRYREAETWDSLFSVMFDSAGVVRMTQNGPDPMYEKTDNSHNN